MKKKIQIHKEGKAPLIRIFALLLLINLVTFILLPDTLFTIVIFGLSLLLFAMTLNFYKKPERTYKGDLNGLVNAPADGQ